MIDVLIPYLSGFETGTVRKSYPWKKLEERDLLSEHFLYCSFNGPNGPPLLLAVENVNFEFLLLNPEHQTQDIFQS